MIPIQRQLDRYGGKDQPNQVADTQERIDEGQSVNEIVSRINSKSIGLSHRALTR